VFLKHEILYVPNSKKITGWMDGHSFPQSQSSPPGDKGCPISMQKKAVSGAAAADSNVRFLCTDMPAWNQKPW
jgi:hypothetical protein